MSNCWQALHCTLAQSLGLAAIALPVTHLQLQSHSTNSGENLAAIALPVTHLQPQLNKQWRKSGCNTCQEKWGQTALHFGPGRNCRASNTSSTSINGKNVIYQQDLGILKSWKLRTLVTIGAGITGPVTHLQPQLNEQWRKAGCNIRCQ